MDGLKQSAALTPGLRRVEMQRNGGGARLLACGLGRAVMPRAVASGRRLQQGEKQHVPTAAAGCRCWRSMGGAKQTECKAASPQRRAYQLLRAAQRAGQQGRRIWAPLHGQHATRVAAQPHSWGAGLERRQAAATSALCRRSRRLWEGRQGRHPPGVAAHWRQHQRLCLHPAAGPELLGEARGQAGELQIEIRAP